MEAINLLENIAINNSNEYAELTNFILSITPYLLLVFSFIEMIKAMGFWILIPLLFIVVGMFQIIKCLFLAKRNINGNNKKQ